MQKKNPRAKNEKEANESLDTSKSPNPQNQQQPGGNSRERSPQPENNGTPRDHSKHP